MDILSDIGVGLGVALSATNLLYCFFGVSVGTLVGVLPGIGPLAAISMLFPVTFYLDPTTALVMLAGIWYGTAYGSSTAAILLNIPGSAISAVTCLDGFPMSKQGRGGVALLMTALASFFGGSIGIIFLMLLSPIVAQYALEFGAPEYFSLMLFGLVAASAITEGSAAKGLAMTVLGIIFGIVGTDIYTGAQRFTFDHQILADGIGLIPLAMGIFAVAEVIARVGETDVSGVDRKSYTFRAMKPTRDDMRRSIMPACRGTAIGSFFGTLPGTGPAIAAFVSYAFEKRIAKDPSRFGNGAVEGVVAPEASNNAADQTAFIPTLSLGIPGSATMALMLGVLMIHGINPGPALVTERPELFWGLIMSFWIGNLMLLVLNIPMIGIWVRVLLVPYHYLYPAILMFVCIGVYAVSNSAEEVYLVLIFGAIGYGMRLLDLPAAPILLGFILGPLMEEHFRRAMLISHGNFSTFIDRPISAVVIVLTVLMLFWAGWLDFKHRKKANNHAAPMAVDTGDE